MPTIEQYGVIDPPTSLEVVLAAMANLRNAGIMSITLLSDSEVPRPEPRNVLFHVRQATSMKDGSVRISGEETETFNILSILTSADDNKPATAALVLS